MYHLLQYQQRYPQDQLVVVGGAADCLHLRQAGIIIPAEDIDVELQTQATGQEVLQRWTTLLPTHRAEYDDQYGLYIIKMVPLDQEKPDIDILINQETFAKVVSIEGYQVKNLDAILADYRRDLPGQAAELKWLAESPELMPDIDLEVMKAKYQRRLFRYQKLSQLRQ